MTRRPRDTHAGLFHVTTHSVRDTPLFHVDRDRIHFLRELARAVARSDWTCIAYCLMRTHFHLILEVPDRSLPRGMHALNFRYASWFNGEYGYRGHVTAARYWSRRIGDDADLLVTYRYVARNPVAAMLCDEPGEWQWSSYAGTIGRREPDGFVPPEAMLDRFSGPFELRVADLRRFVEGP